jgi:hypothetical protein
MTFPGMLDHRADVCRPAPPGSADPLGDERDVFTAVHENVRCGLWSVHAPLTDWGAGDVPQGSTGMTFEASSILQDEDVIVLRSGPEAPKRWRVIANRSPGRRFGRPAHHREVIAEPWQGDMLGYDIPVPSEGS